MHPALASTRPLVFAHRGGSKIGPENTIEGFDRGLAAGADGLELDVRLSRDGRAIVHHDRMLGRTNRGRGRVRDHTTVELAAFDVPTLREVLDRYRNTRLIVELKEPREELVRAVVDDIRVAGTADHVCLGSFSVRALAAARALDPAMATSAGRFEVRMALYCSWINVSPVGRPYCTFQVPETSGVTRVVSPRFVRVAHKAGIAVQVWTVDDPQDIRRLLDWGVDGIISDRPDVAAEVVRDWAAHRRSAIGESRSPIVE